MVNDENFISNIIVSAAGASRRGGDVAGEQCGRYAESPW
ncbi:flagellar protein flhE [Escherichia coli 2-177-06_S4_C1]|nr:flagellar protein flhE [Escherichia coli 2-177-06_S4_C1]